jgi:hypothetical protein
MVMAAYFVGDVSSGHRVFSLMIAAASLDNMAMTAEGVETTRSNR